MGAWDAVAIQYVNSRVSDEDASNQTVSEAIQAETKKKRESDEDSHHTIPVYLCGAIHQPMYARIKYADHVAIHAEIGAIGLTIGAAEKYAYKVLGKGRLSEVLKIAQTEEGRTAIALALEGVYSSGWWYVGRPPNTIGNAFEASKPGYISGAETSLAQWCSRNNDPNK
jgi:hypothetical protein